LSRCKNKEKNDERGRGATREYFDGRVKVERLQSVMCVVQRVSDRAVALGVEGRIILKGISKKHVTNPDWIDLYERRACFEHFSNHWATLSDVN